MSFADSEMIVWKWTASSILLRGSRPVQINVKYRVINLSSFFMNDKNSRMVMYLVDIYDFTLAEMYLNQRIGRDGFEEMEAGVGIEPALTELQSAA